MRCSFRSSPDEYSETDLYKLEEKIGVRFKNQALLVAAVTLRAYVKELRDKQPDIVREDNERLEFLGDGVLELAVRHSLYDKHEYQEGRLSQMSDELVSDKNLTKVALYLALEKHLFLGATEVSDEKGKPAILADALEAIIGAVYLDQGLKETIEIVERLIQCQKV
jgi:ribonuclease-3